MTVVTMPRIPNYDVVRTATLAMGGKTVLAKEVIIIKEEVATIVKEE